MRRNFAVNATYNSPSLSDLKKNGEVTALLMVVMVMT